MLIKTALKALLIGVGTASALTVLSQIPVGAMLKSTLGPVDPNTGYPTWYEDTTGLRLALCIDNNGLCLSSPPDPTQPASVATGNFPDEAFWWAAEAEMATNRGGRARLTLATEAAFANDEVVPGEQITFNRIRIRVDNLVAGATYKVTHPYGVDTFVATGSGSRGINSTQDIGCCSGSANNPCNFVELADSRIGPWLKWDPAIAPAAPAGYIGDPNIPHRVVGSPYNTNFFRIEGPNVGGPGINRIETNLFSVAGKRFQ